MKQSFSMFLACMLLMTGCLGGDDDSDTEIVLYEGDEPGECSDGADNDKDGLFDCDDDQCAGSPACKDDGEVNEEPAENNTENPEQNNTEEKYVYGLDYGTGWDEGDLAHNINFTDGDGKSFELYQVSTNFIVLTFSAEWDGVGMELFASKENNAEWLEYSDNFTDIILVVEDSNSDPPSLDTLSNLQTQFPSSGIMTKGVHMGGESITWDTVNIDEVPWTIFMEKNDDGKFVIDTWHAGINYDYMNYILDKIKGVGDVKDDSPVEVEGNVYFGPCYVHVDYRNSSALSHWDEAYTIDYMPEWCNNNGPESLGNSSEFIEISGINETSNIVEENAESVLYSGLWLYWEYPNNLYNYTTDKGIIYYAECIFPFENVELNLHGDEFCFDGNLTEYKLGPNDSISDNGEFYCHLTLRNGNLVPFSCERYEIVEINGQSILFVSGIDLSNIPLEDVQNGDNFVAFSECYVHVDYRNSSAGDHWKEMYVDDYMPEWCNGGTVNRHDFINMSDFRDDYYEACCDDELLYNGLWLYVWDEINGPVIDYLFVYNYTTDKGMNGYADTECNEEEGQTILELHGHNLCLFHGKENLTENEFLSDNGEFYCHSIAINGVLIPIYCDRYEIVEINGNHILFVSVAESTWFED